MLIGVSLFGLFTVALLWAMVKAGSDADYRAEEMLKEKNTYNN